jgi:ABC-2 type transport system permease protein
MTAAAASAGRLRVGLGELRKLPAFLRRDFLQATSYPMGFLADAAGLVSQTIVLYYVSELVDPASLPEYGGEPVSYIEYVVVGIAISMFIGLGLFRAAAAFRREQLMGTLESVLMTPTSTTTVQLGSVAYDLIYVPLRTLIFFGLVAVTLDLSFDPGGLLPALATLALFVPFVWGLGIAYAAANLTFRVGGAGGLVGLLTITSGAYFPITLFPSWLEWLAEHNPMTVAIEAMRDCMLGGAGWSAVTEAASSLVPAAAISLAGGILLFRRAMRRERRRGSVGLY